MRKRQVPDQRGPGEREGVPGLPPRGDERRRPQLAAGQGQRDLPSGRRPGAARGVRLPGRAERGDARRTSSARRRSRAIRSWRPTCARSRSRRRISPPRRAPVGVAARTTTRMMRTTCVATQLAGGHATNALPQMATRQRQLPHPARRVAGVGEGRSSSRCWRIRRSRCRSSARRTPSKPSPLRPDVMSAGRVADEGDVPGRRSSCR